MSVPGWWAFLLLGLAAYRVWKLVAEDDILDWPRRKLLRLSHDWQDGQPTGDNYRLEWAVFITCPWCAGFWIALAWWGAWQLNEKWALIIATPFALSAGVGFMRNKLDPPEE